MTAPIQIRSLPSAPSEPTPPLQRADFKIISGAPEAGFPEVCMLDRGGRTCTGTLIHPLWVLTAAHCLGDDVAAYPSTVSVIFNLPSGGQITRRVVAAYPHPKWGSLASEQARISASDDYIPYDIALLRLDRAVNTTSIKPARLAGDDVKLTAGTRAKFVGYGLSVPGDAQRKVLPSMSGSKLSADIELGEIAERSAESKITGGKRNLICQGDSGGPAFVSHDGYVYLVAVNSSTSNKYCNDTARHILVAPFMGWIRNKIVTTESVTDKLIASDADAIRAQERASQLAAVRQTRPLTFAELESETTSDRRFAVSTAVAVAAVALLIIVPTLAIANSPSPRRS